MFLITSPPCCHLDLALAACPMGGLPLLAKCCDGLQRLLRLLDVTVERLDLCARGAQHTYMNILALELTRGNPHETLASARAVASATLYREEKRENTNSLHPRRTLCMLSRYRSFSSAIVSGVHITCESCAPIHIHTQHNTYILHMCKRNTSVSVANHAKWTQVSVQRIHAVAAHLVRLEVTTQILHTHVCIIIYAYVRVRERECVCVYRLQEREYVTANNNKAQKPSDTTKCG